MGQVIEFPIHRIRPSQEANITWLEKVFSTPMACAEANRIIEAILSDTDDINDPEPAA